MLTELVNVMNDSEKCRVKIVGGTGYTGGELFRILHDHPRVEIVSVTAAGLAAPSEPLYKHWSWLRGITDMPVSEETECDRCGADVVFLSTPHNVSMKLAPAYLETGCKVIDLSADYRFPDPAERDRWYGTTHASPALCAEAVYGLPELFRDQIKPARLIANPGCYPTGSILGLYPGLKSGMLKPSGIHISAASGASGAGKNAKILFHHTEMTENFFAYRVGSHQHLAGNHVGAFTCDGG